MAASEIVREIKKAIIDAEGTVKLSDFYLTELKNNEQIQLAMPPEEVKARTSASFRTFNIIERGEVKIPKGEQLTDISWTGYLPGATMLMYGFTRAAAWQQPKEIIATFKRWREDGSKLKLLITQTPINLDVYIKAFDYEFSGGQGNVKYTINLIAAKEMKILTVEESDAQRKAKENSQNDLLTRATKSRTGMLIGNVRNLWELAQILSGNGGNWEAIGDLNGIDQPDVLDPSTWVIYM